MHGFKVLHPLMSIAAAIILWRFYVFTRQSVRATAKNFHLESEELINTDFASSSERKHRPLTPPRWHGRAHSPNLLSIALALCLMCSAQCIDAP